MVQSTRTNNWNEKFELMDVNYSNISQESKRNFINDCVSCLDNVCHSKLDIRIVNY